MATELKAPQQQVYDAVFLASMNLGYRTVNYLPAKDFGYPFVFVGEQSDQDYRTKDVIYGRVQQTVHVYHSNSKRRDLTTMMNNLKTEFRKLKHTENFYVTCKSITAQTLMDNTDTEPLLHGIIEVEFQFN